MKKLLIAMVPILLFFSGCGGVNGVDEGGSLKDEAMDHLSTCEQPAYSGRCKALFRRYYYDSSSGSCKMFNYGGCDANDNNFETEADCLAKCGAHDDSLKRTHPRP